MQARWGSSLASRLPAGGNNFTNITFINSHSTFQIPNDVAYGEPGRHRRQRDASGYLPSRAVSPCNRRHGSAHVRSGIQGLEDPRLRRSDQRLDLWRGAQRRRRRPSETVARRRTAPMRLSRSGHPSYLPTMCAYLARRRANRARLHHAGRLQSGVRARTPLRPVFPTISPAS